MSRCARVGQGSRLLAIAAIVRADADVEACAITARRDYWQSFLCEAGHGSRIPWRRGRSDGDSGHRRCCGDARRRPSPGWCVGGGGEVYFDRRRRRVDRVHARCRRQPRTEFRRGLAEEGSGGAAFNVHRPRRSGRRAAGDDGDASFSSRETSLDVRTVVRAFSVVRSSTPPRRSPVPSTQRASASRAGSITRVSS